MRIDRNVPLRLLAVLALAVALVPWPNGRAAAGPFDTLLGSWQGAGQIKLSDGRTERLKCNAYYTGGGSQLGMAIRCQSESSNVEIRSKLSQTGRPHLRDLGRAHLQRRGHGLGPGERQQDQPSDQRRRVGYHAGLL